MLKWCEISIEGTVFEAFLPEHDAEGKGWLLRASRRGHVLAERTIPILWRPTFGPDGGDVAAIDDAIDRWATELHESEPPAGDGDYRPGPVEVADPDPYQHAVLHQAMEDYKVAAAELGLIPELTSALLELPNLRSIEDLYPVAITGRRYGRMKQIVALQHLMSQHPALEARKAAILAAVVAGNSEAIRAELEAADVPT